MKISVLVIPISKPILIGIYKNGTLIKNLSLEGKASDVLPNAFQEIQKQYHINELLYINGPGSYMAIKVAYIFLQTISQILKIDFFATMGFHFNNYSPIKALGKKYFHITKHNKIILDSINENTVVHNFVLPQIIDYSIFTKNTIPHYHIPAIY